MISVALLGLFMMISYLPTILFLAAWSFGTIKFYKLFLEDLVPMSPEVIEERQKARDESQQKMNELWKAVTGSDDDDEDDTNEKKNPIKESFENLKSNTEQFIQSVMEPSESATPVTNVARKVTVALRKKVNL